MGGGWGSSEGVGGGRGCIGGGGGSSDWGCGSIKCVRVGRGSIEWGWPAGRGHVGRGSIEWGWPVEWGCVGRGSASIGCWLAERCSVGPGTPVQPSGLRFWHHCLRQSLGYADLCVDTGGSFAAARAGRAARGAGGDEAGLARLRAGDMACVVRPGLSALLALLRLVPGTLCQRTRSRAAGNDNGRFPHRLRLLALSRDQLLPF